MNYRLAEINIYPVKSLGGISLNEAEVTDRGLKYDRRWMLVDINGNFITQRIIPEMALIKTEIDKTNLNFFHKNDFNIKYSIPLDFKSREVKNVNIWDDNVEAIQYDGETNEWFSNLLNIKCSLVQMPESTRRLVDKNYAQQNEIVSFADGFPFLLIGEASLEDLNSRLEEKIPMNRFRPNLVFTGGKAFDEDKMKSFRLNETTFFPVKTCARCVITTIDQERGAKGKEPLSTLSFYRTQNNKVMFGQNVVHDGCGIIKVGNHLESIQWK